MATFFARPLRPACHALIPMIWTSLHLQWGVASFRAMAVPPHSLGGIHIIMGGPGRNISASPLLV
jgi:hypothetical protein